MVNEQALKEAFIKIKEEFSNLRSEINSLNKKIDEINEKINNGQEKAIEFPIQPEEPMIIKTKEIKKEEKPLNNISNFEDIDDLADSYY